MDSPQLQGDSGPRSRMSEEAHSIGTEQVVSGIEKDKILTESKAITGPSGYSRVTML